MIQITAYLRDESDLARWKALKNKTEFLHEALHKDDKAQNFQELRQRFEERYQPGDIILNEPHYTPPEGAL